MELKTKKKERKNENKWKHESRTISFRNRSRQASVLTCDSTNRQNKKNEKQRNSNRIRKANPRSRPYLFRDENGAFNASHILSSNVETKPNFGDPIPSRNSSRQRIESLGSNWNRQNERFPATETKFSPDKAVFRLKKWFSGEKLEEREKCGWKRERERESFRKPKKSDERIIYSFIEIK